jgi:ABC-type lipoprotein export system ATPase subunit
MTPSGAPVIELRAVSTRGGASAALHEISLAVRPGTFTLLRGVPGGGGLELLRILSLVAAPESGTVLVEGISTSGWTDEQRADYRARRFGFLLAAPFLLPSLSAIENVAMPIFKRCAGTSSEQAAERARALLAYTGVTRAEQTLAGELPHRDQYGVAMARALANEPAALLVEALDESLAAEDLPPVAALLRQVAAERSMAVVATVSPRFVPAASDRTIEIEEGRLRAEPMLAGTPLN